MNSRNDSVKKKGLDDAEKDFLIQLKKANPFTTIQELLNSLPSAVAIIDSLRRVVFVNEFLLKNLGIESLEKIFGKQPGEVLSCLHSLSNDNQCGTSEQCNFCGLLQSIKKTQISKGIEYGEMRLTAVLNGIFSATDYKITVSPFLLEDKAYMLVFITDISHEKRRKVLERIFFHDIMNKVSSLKLLIELFQGKYNIDDYKELIDTFQITINDLNSEIQSQRQLYLAESGELSVNFIPVDINKIIEGILKETEQFARLAKVTVKFKKCKNIKLSTDQVLLNRVITNMLKNAIEASVQDNEVTLTAVINKEGNAVISVHNKTYIPKEIQLQIFQRSFSSKGADRGLGTYSIKLLTERYLEGKVYFTSSEENGTKFFIELPVKPGKSLLSNGIH